MNHIIDPYKYTAAGPPPGGGALKTNLLACWELDESSGTIAYDSHTNNYHMTVINTPLLNQPGIVGTSYLFDDGQAEHCRINVGNALTPVTNHSVSSWFKMTGNNRGTNETLMSRYYSQTGLRLWYFTIVSPNHATVANEVRWVSYDTTNTAARCYYQPGSDIWTGVWHHMVGTRAGSVMNLYLDGNLITPTLLVPGNGSQQTANEAYIFDEIGAFSKSTTTPDALWVGNIDQCASWDRELNQADVTELWNGGLGLAYSLW